MTVYVDDMKAKLNRGFRKYVLSHMIADTEAELHAMARRIEVARKHFQGDHYDICQSKRRLAVAFGAKEITKREAARIIHERRLAAYDKARQEELP